MDGGLVLGPRPGKKSKAALAAMGLTHVVTLLGEQETPKTIERIASELGCGWVWLPIPGADLETLRELDIAAMLTQLGKAISESPTPRVYLHCSAGIHRTGFFASLLLRLQPLDVDEVPKALATLRLVTAQQIGEDRIALAVAHADALLAKE
jgi:protein-tyrosine phosphatase